MDWNKGYSASYYMAEVDPDTWRDIARIEITGGSIKRSTDDLKESADIDCVSYDQTRERWVRVYLDARQGQNSEHVALFSGLATSPDRDIDGNRTTNTVQCYSVLKPAEDVLLQRGWYVAAGAAGASVIKELLGVTPAPIEIADNSPALTDTIIAEDGESNLSMAVKILDAINWRIRILGDGTVQVLPKSDEEVTAFDPLTYDIIEPKVSVSNDWFSCPNVFRAIADGLYATVKDEDEDSALSIPTRGREIWMEEDNCDLNDGESLAEYAARRLTEEQAVMESVDYDRRYHPDLLVTDAVRLNYPAQGVTGVYRVESQSIDLGYACRTAEEVVKI